jgi:hypothetical protein
MSVNLVHIFINNFILQFFGLKACWTFEFWWETIWGILIINQINREVVTLPISRITYIHVRIDSRTERIASLYHIYL